MINKGLRANYLVIKNKLLMLMMILAIIILKIIKIIKNYQLIDKMQNPKKNRKSKHISNSYKISQGFHNLNNKDIEKKKMF